MISNYMCANFDCNYTTGRTDDLTVKELNAYVKEQGGYVKGQDSMCPKCKKNFLVYVSEPSKHYESVVIKDLNLHSVGRLESDVIQTWKEYKQSILTNVVFGEGKDFLPKDKLVILDQSPEAVEIAVDTTIGWLNSHVGRTFISKAFGVDIPPVDPKGTE